MEALNIIFELCELNNDDYDDYDEQIKVELSQHKNSQRHPQFDPEKRIKLVDDE